MGYLLLPEAPLQSHGKVPVGGHLAPACPAHQRAALSLRGAALGAGMQRAGRLMPR